MQYLNEICQGIARTIATNYMIVHYGGLNQTLDKTNRKAMNMIVYMCASEQLNFCSAVLFSQFEKTPYYLPCLLKEKLVKMITGPWFTKLAMIVGPGF